MASRAPPRSRRGARRWNSYSVLGPSSRAGVIRRPVIRAPSMAPPTGGLQPMDCSTGTWGARGWPPSRPPNRSGPHRPSNSGSRLPVTGRPRPFRRPGNAVQSRDVGQPPPPTDHGCGGRAGRRGRLGAPRLPALGLARRRPPGGARRPALLSCTKHREARSGTPHRSGSVTRVLLERSRLVTAGG